MYLGLKLLWGQICIQIVISRNLGTSQIEILLGHILVGVFYISLSQLKVLS